MCLLKREQYSSSIFIGHKIHLCSTLLDDSINYIHFDFNHESTRDFLHVSGYCFRPIRRLRCHRNRQVMSGEEKNNNNKRHLFESFVMWRCREPELSRSGSQGFRLCIYRNRAYVSLSLSRSRMIWRANGVKEVYLKRIVARNFSSR